ncbi:MAG TPA: DNA alkylation repair protein [Terriglobales bacterium]|nr:DNA alkylation repair protein [Terriglobales bacterium]
MAQPKRISSRTALTLADIKNELGRASDAKRAKNLAWFFKTGKGEYGEGDQFCGITVPALRKIASRYRDLKLSDMKKLLGSAIHEHRLAALLILVEQYKRADASARGNIFDFYLANTRCINNWDLVDASARDVVGEHLASRSRKILYTLAKSADLWERRIAIIATHAFIRRGDLTDAFNISELLLGDKHDLIHKAVGWMLREAGKQSEPQLVRFLKTHYSAMARTTLRYAIERMPETVRKRYLRGEFD